MLTNSGLLVLALITSVRLLFPKYFAAKPAEALTIRSVVQGIKRKQRMKPNIKDSTKTSIARHRQRTGFLILVDVPNVPRYQA